MVSLEMPNSKHFRIKPSGRCATSLNVSSVKLNLNSLRGMQKMLQKKMSPANKSNLNTPEIMPSIDLYVPLLLARLNNARVVE